MMKLMLRAHRTAMLAAVLAVLTAPLAALALYFGDYLSAASNAFVFLSCLFMYRTNCQVRDTTLHLHTIRQMAIAAEAAEPPQGGWLVPAGACPKCQTKGQARPSDIVVIMECGACHHRWPARPVSPNEPSASHRVH